jgi:hypothetical protein
VRVVATFVAYMPPVEISHEYVGVGAPEAAAPMATEPPTRLATLFGFVVMAGAIAVMYTSATHPVLTDDPSVVHVI